MVTPPKCTICNTAHWGSEHVWPDKAPAKAEKPAKRAIPKPPPVVVQAGPKRDRAAYMRAYRARKLDQ